MPRVTGLLLLLIALPSLAGEVLLHNATLYTVDPDAPRAEAMVYSEDGEILAVGKFDLLRENHPDAALLDAGGKTVIPGLIDAHAHLMGLGVSLLRADLVGTESKAEVLDRLKAFAADLPEGEWLLGRGWDQNDWPEQRFPTRHDLDSAFPDRPVWLTRIDGHAGWANTAALKKAGLMSADVPDPEGGSIRRDGEGRPTGVLVDAAMDLVGSAVPPMTPEQYARALGLALEQTTRHGLTGVHEAGTSLAAFHLYQTAIDMDAFPIRLYAMADGEDAMLDKLCEDGPVIEYRDRLVARSVKLYMDGALGSRGAALLADYSDDPGNQGLLQMSRKDYLEAVSRAMGCGLQVNTHAIGDRGNRLVLDVYEATIAATGGGPGRHRVEHAQVLAPSDIPRFHELDVIASVQPTHATSDMPWAEKRLGPERIEGAYAWRRLKEAGARLALGSDFPVESVNPMLGIYAAVTRQDLDGHPKGGWQPDQRLTRAEALKGFTLDTAYAAFMETQVGSLSPGKRADFVILDRDIMTVPAEEIPEIRVLATYLDGKAVYRRK